MIGASSAACEIGAVEISRIATVRAAKDCFLMRSKVLLAYRSCIESILGTEKFFEPGAGAGSCFKLVGYCAVEIFEEDKGCDKDDKPAKGDVELLSLYSSGEHRSNNGTDGCSHNCEQDDSEIKFDIGIQ